MVVSDYRHYSHKVSFPAFTQPKIDGIRCVGSEDGLFSRNKLKFDKHPEILSEVQYLCNKYKVILDGDLYNPDLNLQQLVSAVKAPKDVSVYYYIFDIIDTELSFGNRLLKLLEILGKEKQLKFIRSINTEVVNNHFEIHEKHESYIKQGYEGTIIRNDSPYQLGECYNVFKYKDFFDEEFMVKNVLPNGSFVMLMPDGKSTFKGTPSCSKEDKKRFYKDRVNIIGKKATIQYAKKTVAGFPGSATVKAIRDYE